MCVCACVLNQNVHMCNIVWLRCAFASASAEYNYGCVYFLYASFVSTNVCPQTQQLAKLSCFDCLFTLYAALHPTPVAVVLVFVFPSFSPFSLFLSLLFFATRSISNDWIALHGSFAVQKLSWFCFVLRLRNEKSVRIERILPIYYYCVLPFSI